MAHAVDYSIFKKNSFANVVNMKEIIYFRILNLPVIFVQFLTKLSLYEEDTLRIDRGLFVNSSFLWTKRKLHKAKSNWR
jgi:hypothetical protein